MWAIQVCYCCLGGKRPSFSNTSSLCRYLFWWILERMGYSCAAPPSTHKPLFFLLPFTTQAQSWEALPLFFTLFPDCLQGLDFWNRSFVFGVSSLLWGRLLSGERGKTSAMSWRYLSHYNCQPVGHNASIQLALVTWGSCFSPVPFPSEFLSRSNIVCFSPSVCLSLLGSSSGGLPLPPSCPAWWLPHELCTGFTQEYRSAGKFFSPLGPSAIAIFFDLTIHLV